MSSLFGVARRLALVLVCACAVVPAARAATTPVTAPAYDAKGRLIQTPLAPPANAPHLTKARALVLVEKDPKVAAWLTRYPDKKGLLDEETYDPKTVSWTVKIWLGKAGEVVEATVDGGNGGGTAAWTGPQGAWKMAPGYKGAFGGAKINSPWIWARSVSCS